jgi:hypothetical protein
MSDLDPLKSLWRSQKDEPMTMTEAQLRTRTDKFAATIWWRNAREYAAAALVAVFFGYFALTDANPVKQMGAAAVVLAALFVSWRMWVHAGAGASAAPTAPWAERHRAQMVRQRDVLASVWRWYALPFVPGLALMLTARHAYPDFKLDQPEAWLSLAWPLAFVAIILGGVIWLNHVAANKLQSEIDELDRANHEENA